MIQRKWDKFKSNKCAKIKHKKEIVKILLEKAEKRNNNLTL
jgi:hypothetical protein